jgi:hypothetical protein
MATRKTLDRRPGPVPEIRAERDSVLFHFDVAGLRREARLIVRCAPDGNVYMSIPSERPARERQGRRRS